MLCSMKIVWQKACLLYLVEPAKHKYNKTCKPLYGWLFMEKPLALSTVWSKDDIASLWTDTVRLQFNAQLVEILIFASQF